VHTSAATDTDSGSAWNIQQVLNVEHTHSSHEPPYLQQLPTDNSGQGLELNTTDELGVYTKLVASQHSRIAA
jgi:hypothetical protein